MNGDLDEMRRRGWAIVSALNGGSEVRINLRNAATCGLDRWREGSWTRANSPARAPSATCLRRGVHRPVEGTAEGLLVVDGSIAAIGLVESPVRLTVEGGHLTGATGRRRRVDARSRRTGQTAPTSPSSGSAPTRRRS